MRKFFKIAASAAVLIGILAFLPAVSEAAPRAIPLIFSTSVGGTQNWTNETIWTVFGPHSDNLYPGGADVKDIFSIKDINGFIFNLPAGLFPLGNAAFVGKTPGTLETVTLNLGGDLVFADATSFGAGVSMILKGAAQKVEFQGAITTDADAAGNAINAEDLGTLAFKGAAINALPRKLTVSAKNVVQFDNGTLPDPTKFILSIIGDKFTLKPYAAWDVFDVELSGPGTKVTLDGQFTWKTKKLPPSADTFVIGDANMEMSAPVMAAHPVTFTGNKGAVIGKLMGNKLVIDTTNGNCTFDAKVEAGDSILVTGGKEAEFKKALNTPTLAVANPGSSARLPGNLVGVSGPAVTLSNGGKLSLTSSAEFSAAKKLSVAFAKGFVELMSPDVTAVFKENGALDSNQDLVQTGSGTLAFRGANALNSMTGKIEAVNVTFGDVDSGNGNKCGITLEKVLGFDKNEAKLMHKVTFKNEGEVSIKAGTGPALVFPNGADGFVTNGPKHELKVNVAGTPQPDGTKTILFRDDSAAPNILNKLGIDGNLANIKLPAGWGPALADAAEVYVTKTSPLATAVDFDGAGKISANEFVLDKTGTFTITASAKGDPFTVAVPAALVSKWGGAATIAGVRKVPADGDKSPMTLTIEVKSLPAANITETFKVTLNGAAANDLKITIISAGGGKSGGGGGGCSAGFAGLALLLAAPLFLCKRN